jgi:hypothetical protein
VGGILATIASDALVAAAQAQSIGGIDPWRQFYNGMPGEAHG